jgi:putative FmdB family regulatory protein
MPTYEYACQSCGTHVEVYQRFSDEALTECGVCGGPLRKVFHPAGILFKGSGFYVTDSRSGKAGAPESKKEPSKEKAVPASSDGSKASDAKAASGDRGGGGSASKEKSA